MDVVLFLSLTLVVFRISTRGSWSGLDLDAMTLSVYGSLIGYIFLQVLPLLRHPAPLLPCQLPPPLLLLLSGIAVLDISPAPGFPLLLVVVF